MLISVVVTTYNQPDWLEKVLWSLGSQPDRNFEVLVADDGSGPETRELVARADTLVGVPVRHVWHEDSGFRKCAILNQAILASRGDYLFFTDGDCLLRADCLAVHRRLATPGYFLSGGYTKLPLSTSQRISREDVLSGRATSARGLRALGAPWSHRLIRLSAGPALGSALDRLTTTRATFNGHNASVWRSDAIRVNGFDERLAYGGLDREFGERLENAGVRGRQVRHRALVVHLDHPRGYRDAAVVAHNRALRADTVASGRTRAVEGLDRYG